MVVHMGPVDPTKYPLPKTKLTLNWEICLCASQNQYDFSGCANSKCIGPCNTHVLPEHGFLYVHTPIITSSDWEGAGDMFQVTTFINDAENVEKELIKNPLPS